jgi:cytochrome b involved in lipid metabolism
LVWGRRQHVFYSLVPDRERTAITSRYFLSRSAYFFVLLFSTIQGRLLSIQSRYDESSTQLSIKVGYTVNMNHPSNNTQAVQLTGEEVAKHNNADSCWVIVHGRAYDVTEFLPEHPGGPKIILKYAGKDASEEYDPIHPPDTLDKFLDKSKHLGEVDMNTVQQEAKEEDPDEAERQERIKRMPILEQCYNLMDFEAVARRVMKKTAWAYYSSGADDEIVSLVTSHYLDYR